MRTPSENNGSKEKLANAMPRPMSQACRVQSAKFSRCFADRNFSSDAQSAEDPLDDRPKLSDKETQ